MTFTSMRDGSVLTLYSPRISSRKVVVMASKASAAASRMQPPRGLFALHGANFVHTALMARSMREGGVQPLVDNLESLVVGDDGCTQRHYVRVIVLAREGCLVLGIYLGGADAGNLVCRDRHAYTGAAHQDSEVGCVAGNLVS